MYHAVLVDRRVSGGLDKTASLVCAFSSQSGLPEGAEVVVHRSVAANDAHVAVQPFQGANLRREKKSNRRQQTDTDM